MIDSHKLSCDQGWSERYGLQWGRGVERVQDNVDVGFSGGMIGV